MHTKKVYISNNWPCLLLDPLLTHWWLRKKALKNGSVTNGACWLWDYWLYWLLGLFCILLFSARVMIYKILVLVQARGLF